MFEILSRLVYWDQDKLFDAKNSRVTVPMKTYDATPPPHT
jgi:hypothetical protein